MNIEQLKIGLIFTLLNKKSGGSVRKERKLTIVGIYYEGNNGNSDWKIIDDLMKDQTMYIQYTIESHYTFSNPTIDTQKAKEFIKEFNEDQKLLPEYRTYKALV